MRNEIHSQFGPDTTKASVGYCLRQFMAAALAAALLVGCASRQAIAPGAPDDSGYSGAVAADEPQAALVGRDILIAGGSAADAATAMYFTMAVTLPTQASLGGGGTCVTYNSLTDEAQALDFLARPSAEASGAERPTAIPGNIRGFYALHGVYGRLRWSQLIAPAENLARFGVPVSRALSNDLAPLESVLAREPQMRRLFSAEGGRRMVVEGDTLVQSDLAEVLASVRTSGPGDFYSGPLAKQFLKGVHEAGGALDAADLASYQPVWRKPMAVGFDDKKAYFAPPPPAGGVIAGQMWSMLVKDDLFARGLRRPAGRGIGRNGRTRLRRSPAVGFRHLRCAGARLFGPRHSTSRPA